MPEHTMDHLRMTDSPPLMNGSECDNQAPSVDTVRQTLLSIGTVLSVIGTLTNLFTIVVLCSVKKFRRSSYVYFLFLAVTDAVLCIVYVPVVVVGRYYLAWDNIWVARFWWATFPSAITVTVGAKTFGTYILLAATVEKYLLCCTTSRFGTRSKMSRVALRSRCAAVVCALTLSVALTLPKYFEFEIQPTNCTGVWSHRPAMGTQLSHWRWLAFYRDHVCTNMQITVPFIVLSLLSGRIVCSLWRIRATQNKLDSQLQIQTVATASSNGNKVECKRSNVSLLARLRKPTASDCAGMMSNSVIMEHHLRRHKSKQRRRPYNERLRSVTCMVVLVVLSYLLSNSLQLVLTYWEIFANLNAYSGFHNIASDCVTVLSLFVSSTRLLLYLAFGDNHAFRKRSRELCQWLAMGGGLCGNAVFCRDTAERYTDGEGMYLTAAQNASIVCHSPADHQPHQKHSSYVRVQQARSRNESHASSNGRAGEPTSATFGYSQHADGTNSANNLLLVAGHHHVKSQCFRSAPRAVQEDSPSDIVCSIRTLNT